MASSLQRTRGGVGRTLGTEGNYASRCRTWLGDERPRQAALARDGAPLHTPISRTTLQGPALLPQANKHALARPPGAVGRLVSQQRRQTLAQAASMLRRVPRRPADGTHRIGSPTRPCYINRQEVAEYRTLQRPGCKLLQRQRTPARLAPTPALPACVWNYRSTRVG